MRHLLARTAHPASRRARATATVLAAALLAATLLAACSTGAADSPADSLAAVSAAIPSGDSARLTPAGDTTSAATPTAGVARRDNLRDENAIVRALYVNRWAAQSRNRMRALIEMADQTEINALVIDMKDEFGLNYRSADESVARMAGTSGAVPQLEALLDTLWAHDILPIARIVVFKDSVAARLNPSETIRTDAGGVWRDEKGLPWVNPYSASIREYNMKVAEELVRLGFGEVQFDYIRFPEPYKRLATQSFPNANGVSKPDAIAAFLREAQQRMTALGVRSTADVFGLTTTVGGPLEIGQHWERLAPVTDVLLPMVYPSHYPPGSFNIRRPNAEPGPIVKTAITRARERTEALGLQGERVRPYLQAFSLGQPPYGAAEVRAQIQATYESGYDGWVLWHPGSKYEPFLPAIEKGATVSRKVK